MRETIQQDRPRRRTIWRELRLLAEGLIERRTFLSKKKHPRLFRYVGIPSTPILIYLLVAMPYFGAPDPRDFLWKESPRTQVAAVGGLSCQQFNPDEWEQEYGDLDFDGSVWTVANGAGGGLIRHREKVPLNASIKLTMIPSSETQVNFFITTHDLYEMVVGDGDYRGITLKTAKGKGQPMTPMLTTDGEDRVIFPMDSGGDVTIVLDQSISQLADGSYTLQLQLAKTSFLNENPSAPKIFATWNFPLPPQYKYEAEPVWFSLGLDAASDDSKVAAEIVCVEIKGADGKASP